MISVEVGCNYSGDHRKGTGVISKTISGMHGISQMVFSMPGLEGDLALDKRKTFNTLIRT